MGPSASFLHPWDVHDRNSLKTFVEQPGHAGPWCFFPQIILDLTPDHVRFLADMYGLSELDQWAMCAEIWEGLNRTGQGKAWAEEKVKALQGYVADPKNKIQAIPFPPLFLTVSCAWNAMNSRKFLEKMKRRYKSAIQRSEDTLDKTIRALDVVLDFLRRSPGMSISGDISFSTIERKVEFTTGMPISPTYRLRLPLLAGEQSVLNWAQTTDGIDHMLELRDTLEAVRNGLQNQYGGKRGIDSRTLPDVVKQSVLGIARLVRESAPGTQPNKRTCELLATWGMKFATDDLSNWKEQASKTHR